MPGKKLENLGQKLQNRDRSRKLGAAHWGWGGAATKYDDVESDENRFTSLPASSFFSSLTTSSFSHHTIYKKICFRRRCFVVSFVAFDASVFFSVVYDGVILSSLPTSLFLRFLRRFRRRRFFRRFRRRRFFRRFPHIFFVAFKVISCRIRGCRFFVVLSSISPSWLFRRFRRWRKNNDKNNVETTMSKATKKMMMSKAMKKDVKAMVPHYSIR